MKIAKCIWVVGAGLLIFQPAYAQKNISYDVAGVFATQDKDGDGDNALGLGLGINYFFHENMGVGLDSYAAGIDWPYLLNASFIYRFSSLKPVTPYGFAGFGRQWQHAPQWMGHLGGGVEYAFASGRSIFGDARWVLPDSTGSYGVLRVGVRFGF